MRGSGRSLRRPGRLVAVEGIDGSGKSTLVRALLRRLRQRGYRVVSLREPSDPGLGRLAAAFGDRRPWEAALAFTVDRLVGRPRVERALRTADLVLTDRSFASTLAYQGSLLPPRLRRQLEALQLEAAVAPDLVVLVDLAPSLAIERLRRRGTTRSSLERAATLARARRAYRALARQGGWWLVDGRRPTDELADRLTDRLGRLLGSPRRRSEVNLGRHRPRRR